MKAKTAAYAKSDRFVSERVRDAVHAKYEHLPAFHLEVPAEWQGIQTDGADYPNRGKATAVNDEDEGAVLGVVEWTVTKRVVPHPTGDVIEAFVDTVTFRRAGAKTQLRAPNPSEEARIQVALALDKVSNAHLVTFTPIEAYAWAGRSASYNRLDAQKLAELVRDVNDIMPKASAEGATVGQWVHTFEVGNEGSRVVYVVLVKTYFGFTQEHWNELAETIMGRARRAMASEVDDQSTPEELRIRCWWD